MFKKDINKKVTFSYALHKCFLTEVNILYKENNRGFILLIIVFVINTIKCNKEKNYLHIFNYIKYIWTEPTAPPSNILASKKGVTSLTISWNALNVFTKNGDVKGYK